MLIAKYGYTDETDIVEILARVKIKQGGKIKFLPQPLARVLFSAHRVYIFLYLDTLDRYRFKNKLQLSVTIPIAI